MKKAVDMVIIGGGPAGLYAAYHAGQRSLSTKLIEALPELGGQLWALYPKNTIRDVAGVPEQKAEDFIDNLKSQALQNNPEICVGEKVCGLQPKGSVFEIETDKATHSGRAVILAVGPGALIPHAIFDCSPEEQKAKGIYIELEDVTDLADRHVLVCGGKEEAVGWAIDAATVADSVTVINWTDVYCADEARVDSMFTRHVDVMTPYELLEIHGDDMVEAASVARCGSDEVVRLKVEAVLMARGRLTNLVNLGDWGLELERNGVAVDRAMQTSIPGVFAAGDIVHYPGKLKSITAGASEAATAVNNAAAYLNPSADAQPDYTAE